MTYDPWRTLLANLLPRLKKPLTRGGCFWLWSHLRRAYNEGRLPVRARVHGRWLWLNAGNPYPFTVREHPLYNRGLITTVAAASHHLCRPVRLIDVGAAVGDTVVLLEERCPGLVSRYLCVDGDENFADFFVRNTREIPHVELVQAMLASHEREVPELVRHHPGTAAALGAKRVAATTLDRIAGERGSAWDILKVDVDGYDGEVLAGAARLLHEIKPVVYFEWHPMLCGATGTSIGRPFEELAKAGYKTFIWFGNRGRLSHASGPPSPETLQVTAEFLKQGLQGWDGHFDVLAIPPRFEPMVARVTALALV